MAPQGPRYIYYTIYYTIYTTHLAGHILLTLLEGGGHLRVLAIYTTLYTILYILHYILYYIYYTPCRAHTPHTSGGWRPPQGPRYIYYTIYYTIYTTHLAGHILLTLLEGGGHLRVLAICTTLYTILYILHTLPGTSSSHFWRVEATSGSSLYILHY